MYSNVMRMTGLFSGMDTEAMVRQLMNAETMKYTRLQQQRQKVEWKQEAYRSVAKSLADFRTAHLSIKPGSISAYGTFNTLASSVKDGAGNNSSAIRVNTSSNSTPVGDLKLEVYSVAQKDAYRGATIDQTFTGGGTISEVDLANGVTFNVSLDGGASKTIDVSADEINNFVAADFNGKLTGAVNKKLKEQFGDGYKVGADGKVVSTNEAKITLNYKDGKGFYFESAAGHTAQISEASSSTNSLADMGFASSGSTAFDVNSTLGITGTEIIVINGIRIEATAEDTYATLMEKINKSDAGVTMTFNKVQSAFTLESKGTGESAAIKIANIKGSDTTSNDGVFKQLGFTYDPNEVTGGAIYTSDTDASKATRISTASNAHVAYNGVLYSRESNTIEIEGVEITLTDAAQPEENSTAPKVFEVSVTRDITKPMEAINNFIEEYNKLIDVFIGQANTARPRSGKYDFYEPLTEDEKEAMDEKDVERWEEKAKTGLLYRDDLLSGIMSEMRNMIYQQVTLEDGTKTSLYQIGITTSGASKNAGKLQIWDEDKLKSALEKTPQIVEELFAKSEPGLKKDDGTERTYSERMTEAGIADRIDLIIGKAIDLNGSIRRRAGIEETSSAFDNTLYNQLSDYDDKMNDMLDYLEKRETYYYNMFARMEQAMNQSNNQMSALLASMGNSGA